MEESVTTPFAIVIHGNDKGDMSSFFYGIDREGVILALQSIVKDYERILNDMRSEEYLQLGDLGNGNGNNNGKFY